ncbi:CHASE3 domain-containing protein [Variovorax sp. GT1P44]|uniref:CHASE3 domain-containing protein n=1 Tax=Variovorax sp. GT1P44 TaxID=3443742 RepID=UPI003F447C8A
MRSIKTFAAQMLRQRYAIPAVVVAALFSLFVDEVASRRSAAIVSEGIELTDARIGTARILQVLTDAETGQRGFILTRQEEFLTPYRRALEALPALRHELRRYLSFTQTDSEALVQRADGIIDAKLSEMAKALDMEARGQHDEAIQLVASGIGRQLMENLRAVFTTELEQARAAQILARLSIYDALQFNRVAAAVLTLAGMIGAIVYLHQLRRHDRERAEREASLEMLVAARTRELRHLARHLQTVREDERGFLAREIHDELGGLLTAAKLDLARMRVRINNEPVLRERIEHAIGLLNDGIAFKRRVIEDLRPSSLEILGVRTAILKLCEDAQNSLGIPVDAELEELRLKAPDDLAVYRFVQEALTNVAKYASASRVRVRLAANAETVSIEVSDDGVGFTQAVALPGRHGLSGMRFRVESLGGSMVIESSPGKGTNLKASLPLASPAMTVEGMDGPATVNGSFG